jgi:hypothetical protein
VQVHVVNTFTGCNSPVSAAGRHLLQAAAPANGNTTNVTYAVNATAANSTARLQLDDVPSSVAAAKVAALYNADPTAAARLQDLNAALATALAAVGAPPLAAPVSTSGVRAATVWPPLAPAPPPMPPGMTPGAMRLTLKGRSMKDLQAAGSAVAYALLGFIVLWMPVHALVHAVTAAHARRTAVSVALALRCVQRAPRASQIGSGPDAAPDKADDEGDDEALAGRRFAAHNLAAALASVLQREAAAASAADVQPSPRHVALRPLLRKPIVAALDVSSRDGGDQQEVSQRLAMRKKPAGAVWRFKRWVASELHWQARELRHAMRALRRCCGRSRDPVGKAFRLVSVGPAAAVLVEATFSFGWSGRHGAACWRRRLRCEAQLAELEAALAAELANANVEVTIILAADDEGTHGAPCGDDGHGARVVTVALLDDEPHANVDKKAKAQRNTSVADDVAEHKKAGADDGRSSGLAPAVAARLEAVLGLCALREQQRLSQAPTAQP